MGPRSGDRGNREKITEIRVLHRLQWGRDLVIAEIGEEPFRAAINISLQWGRDLVIAEIHLLAESLHKAYPRASMGPRSGDRGNPNTSANAPANRPASMGPRSGDRGNAAAQLQHQAQTDNASMGPRSGDRGNMTSIFRFSVRAQCFNGAAIW